MSSSMTRKERPKYPVRNCRISQSKYQTHFQTYDNPLSGIRTKLIKIFSSNTIIHKSDFIKKESNTN